MTSKERLKPTPFSPALAPWCLLSGWFVLSLLLLSGLAWYRGSLTTTSSHNYFHYLAQAFNHGSLNLIETPRSIHDLTIRDGKLFLYWGPLPAVLLSPFVALFGVSWPDAWVTLLLGALIATLALYLLFATAHLHHLPREGSLMLAAVATFGSPILPLALGGKVWASSQLFATTFLLAALCVTFSSAKKGATLASSALVGLAFLCRPSMVGAGVWLACRELYSCRGVPLTSTLRRLALVAVPLMLCAALQVLYNYGRFGHALEFGYSEQNIAGIFRANAHRYGPLSIHYFANNFFYHYLAYPFPFSRDTWWGGSLFLMTPLYFAAFWAFKRSPGASRWLLWSLSIACALIALPSLLVNGTGWVQLGPRYTVDFAPFLLILVAIGMKGWPVWLIALSSFISFGHYAYGLLPKVFS